MTTGASERILGLPLDRLLALYLVSAGVALVFPGRPQAWPLLLLVHLLPVLYAWPPAGLRNAVLGMPEHWQLRLRTGLDWTPLLIVPALYTELALLNTAVHQGRYFDEAIIALEQALFDGQPSREWAAALPELWLSELLHMAYLSYYFIVFLPPLVLYLQGRTDAFRTTVFTLLFSFFVHYLFFIYFPVQGPRYLVAPPGGALAEGTFYQLAHRVLEAGSAQGAAFPSSHVGVSIVQTLITWKFLPRLAPLVALLTLGLTAGAVYGGFHYATDALFGVLLGAAAFAMAPVVRRLLSAAEEP